MKGDKFIPETKPRVSRRKFALRGLAGAGALLLAWLGFYLPVPPAYEAEPMPEPNGYEYFIRAGNMVFFDRNLTTNDNELAWSRPIYNSNQLALAEFRRGMKFDCRVPRLPSDDESWQAWFGEWRAVREIHVALRSEAVVLSAAGENERSARCGMEMIRFGHKTSRGGVLLNALTSSSAIKSGEDILRKEVGDLDVRTLRSLNAELLDLDERQEPFDEIVARDRKVERIVYSGLEDIPDRLKDFFDFEAKRQIRFHFVYRRTQSRLLILTIALEAHRKETGAYPRELGELTPSVLPQLPQDPFGNSEFGYVRNAEGYLLYSYGPDGGDDGGGAIDSSSARKPKGDVAIDRW